MVSQWERVIDKLVGEWYISISLISSGSEAATVYSVKYILAWRRSGW